jgi:hypothetical protein
MSYEIEDFKKYTRKLGFLALGDLVLIIVSLTAALITHFVHFDSSCIFCWVLFGIFIGFMLLIGAERLEINSHKAE